VNLATKVADEIISTGKVTHAFLGLQAEPLSANAVREHGRAEGLRVVAVLPGGPADNAGLAAGDVITSIDGAPAVSTDQLMALTLAKRAGDTVELRTERGGSQRTVKLTLAAQPS
jgi:putative serine protease PepD